MTPKTFTVTIEELPPKRLLGNWMSLNAAEDQTEYAQLKEAFSRRLKAMPGPEPPVGYGVCSDMRDNLDCHYWTAIEAEPDGFVPNGMIPISLDSGHYACLSAPQGTTLAEFYDYMCNFWERAQSAYLIDRHKPCFEFFGQDWSGPVGLRFYVPLKERYHQPELIHPLAEAISA